VDISLQGQKFLSAVMRTSQTFGAHYLIDVLRGSESEKVLANNHQTLSVYGIGKETPKAQWLSIANRLVETDALSQADFGVLKITQRGVDLLKGIEKVSIKEAALTPPKSPKVQSSSNKEILSHEFNTLRGLRYQIAREEKVPAYVIFSDKVLLEISIKLPKTKDEMLSIAGMGAVKYDKYGEQFLSACREMTKPA
jgi:ATP-dependent DNA helicase RecQ